MNNVYPFNSRVPDPSIIIVKTFKNWGLGSDGQLYCLFKTKLNDDIWQRAEVQYSPSFDDMIEIVKAFAHLRVFL